MKNKKLFVVNIFQLCIAVALSAYWVALCIEWRIDLNPTLVMPLIFALSFLAVFIIPLFRKNYNSFGTVIFGKIIKLLYLGIGLWFTAFFQAIIALGQMTSMIDYVMPIFIASLTAVPISIILSVFEIIFSKRNINKEENNQEELKL